MFAGVVFIATFLTNREHRESHRAPAATVDPTPRGRTGSRESSRRSGGSGHTYVEAEYRPFPVVGSRVAIWAVAQLHLLFAAFVLAAPIFAVLIEAIGYKTGDKRYDRLAYEFTKLLSVSPSLTATFGAFLTFMLIALYPKFTNYLMSVFSPTFLPHVCSSSSRPSSSTPITTAGEVPSPGAPCSWESASTSWARASC